MTKAVRWRPLCDPDIDGTSRLVAAAIEPWQRNWFSADVRPPIVAKAVRRIEHGEAFRFPASATVFQLETLLSWSLEPAAAVQLAVLALDLTDRRFSTVLVSERAMLSELGARIIGEMSDALASFGRRPDATGNTEPTQHLPAASARVEIATGGGVLVELATVNGIQIAQVFCPTTLVRRHLGFPASPDRRGNEGLVPASDAVRDSPVSVGVCLGQAELTLRELIELAPGDVIVLNTRLEEPVMLFNMNGTAITSSSTLGRARIGKTRNSLAIRLELTDAKVEATS